MTAEKEPEQTQPMTVDADGTPPTNRFEDASAVWSCYQEALREGVVNDLRLTDIRFMYDGSAPVLGDISNQQLANSGDLPNINLRRFANKLDTYVGNFTMLDCGADNVADIRIRANYCNSPTQQKDWSDAVTCYFTEAVAEWEPDANSMASYVMESTVRNTQMALYGIGYSYFRDQFDWRPIAIPTRSVHVPNGTKVTFRNHQASFVSRTFTATELWEKRGVDGWNDDYIIRFLYEKLGETIPGTSSSNRSPLPAWENWLRNNETWYQRDFRQIHLVECFVQEFNKFREKDGVSKYIISEINGTEFLYEKSREFESINQVIIGFVDNPGPEGDVHGVKGYGDQIYDLCHFQNLFFNHIATMALVTSSPMFTSGTEDERRKLSQIVWSRLGVLYPGLQLTQTNVKVDLNGAMGIMEDSTRTLNEISRIYPAGEEVGSQAKTATQSTFDRQDQSQMTTLQISVYRTIGLDRLFSEMYRRLSQAGYPSAWPGGKAAKRFRDKCLAYGIPAKVFQDPQHVRASRLGGSGNAALDAQRAAGLMRIATPGLGQQNAKKAMAAALAGWDQVGTYIQDVPAQDMDDVTMTLENVDLTLGKLVTAFGFQNHVKHLGTPDPAGPGHLSIMASTRQAAMQIEQIGVKNAFPDAQKLSGIMDATVHHCSEHLQFLQQMLQSAPDDENLKQMVKQLAQVITAFAKFTTAFDQQVQKAAGEQQPQGPQLPVEDQIKLERWNVEKQIILQKAQLDMQMRESQQKQKLGDLAERAAAKSKLSEQQHLQELGQKGEATLLQNRISLVQAQQDAAAQATQNLQEFHKNAVVNTQDLVQNQQQHEQGMAQSQAEHEQNIAQTRAEHNVEQVQPPPQEQPPAE